MAAVRAYVSTCVSAAFIDRKWIVGYSVRVSGVRVGIYTRNCVCEASIRNRVARGTDSTSSIGAPNEEEDRIDSPVT